MLKVSRKSENDVHIHRTNPGGRKQQGHRVRSYIYRDVDAPDAIAWNGSLELRGV